MHIHYLATKDQGTIISNHLSTIHIFQFSYNELDRTPFLRSEGKFNGKRFHVFSTFAWNRAREDPEIAYKNMKKKGLNPFEYNLLFFPINPDNVHWSLVVVVNPNNIAELRGNPSSEKVLFPG